MQHKHTTQLLRMNSLLIGKQLIGDVATHAIFWPHKNSTRYTTLARGHLRNEIMYLVWRDKSLAIPGHERVVAGMVENKPFAVIEHDLKSWLTYH